MDYCSRCRGFLVIQRVMSLHAVMLMQQCEYELQMTQMDQFCIPIFSPRSLTVIERVTQTNLHDVKF